MIGRTLAITVVLANICLAHGTPQESAQPAFRSQTDVVVVPFQVRRGSRPVSDLKPSDVVLLEDGKPRTFTGFEAPSEHPSLELVVMFDVTDPATAGTSSLKHLLDFGGSWNAAMAQSLFEENGAAVRLSIYQFNHPRLRRLVRSTSDPRAALDALHRVSEPIPANEALDLQLPAGVVIRPERSMPQPAGYAWPFSLAGAITVLRHSALASAMGARALVIFSTGAEGTSLRPEDVADQALAADARVYPVALPSTQPVWYAGDSPNVQWEYLPPSGGRSEMMSGPRLPENGICQDIPRRGRAPTDEELTDCPLNPAFKAVGTWTGGRSFEAARRPGPKLPHTGSELLLGRFSMTGAQVNDTLDAVKAHALARFTSTYRVWFERPSSASPRKHKLEVKLVTDSRGKVSDGKKDATY